MKTKEINSKQPKENKNNKGISALQSIFSYHFFFSLALLITTDIFLQSFFIFPFVKVIINFADIDKYSIFGYKDYN